MACSPPPEDVLSRREPGRTSISTHQQHSIAQHSTEPRMHGSPYRRAQHPNLSEKIRLLDSMPVCNRQLVQSRPPNLDLRGVVHPTLR
eukprot:275339-Rhodomonas_salina.2